MEIGFKKLASERNLRHFLELGVFVQREFTVQGLMHRVKAMKGRQQRRIKREMKELERYFMSESPLIKEKKDLTTDLDFASWEALFSGFDSLTQLDEKFRFIERLCTRDLGLMLQTSKNFLPDINAEIANDFEKKVAPKELDEDGEPVVDENEDVDTVDDPMLRVMKRVRIKELKDDDIELMNENLESFVRKTVAPLLYLGVLTNQSD